MRKLLGFALLAGCAAPPVLERAPFTLPPYPGLLVACEAPTARQQGYIEGRTATTLRTRTDRGKIRIAEAHKLMMASDATWTDAAKAQELPAVVVIRVEETGRTDQRRWAEVSASVTDVESAGVVWSGRARVESHDDKNLMRAAAQVVADALIEDGVVKQRRRSRP